LSYLADSQTNKQTKTGKIITSLAKVIRYANYIKRMKLALTKDDKTLEYK